MKNIHLIPTDKPSRLFYLASNLHLEQGQLIAPKNYQNIYITSDEEIKVSDWVLFEGNDNIRKAVDSTFTIGVNNIRIHAAKKVFKIILTTDQDLIKDGVQAIDDEFLEWFVKNPSCEEVETKSIEEIPSGFTFGMFGNDEPPTELVYKIIIPKEEPNYNMKQEIIAEMEKLQEPKQETLEEEFKFKNRQMGAAGFVRNKIMENMSSKFKQETLKEASENYANMHQDVSANLGKPLVKGVFEDGAAWQAERMYSQDEILMAMGYAIGVSGRGSLSHEEVKSSCIEFVESLNKK